MFYFKNCVLGCAQITSVSVGDVLGSPGSHLRKSINGSAVINSTVGQSPRVDNFHFHYCREIIKELQLGILRLKMVFLPAIGSFKDIASPGSLLK